MKCTELQNTVQMTLGQEFGAFANTLTKRFKQAQ